MNPEPNEKKCYFFKIIEFFSAIKLKIEETLADAIRAGNKITIGIYIEYLSIDIFCYEDVAFNIMEKIKNIIFDIDWNSTDFILNNEIYKNIIFDDFLSYNKFDILDILDISEYYFYGELKNNLFNKYEFFPDEFDYEACIQNLDLELDNLKTFIINGYIYGYYEEKEAQKISDLFYTNNSIDNLKILLDNVNNTEIYGGSPDNYIVWAKEIKEFNKTYEKNISVKVYNKSEFFNFGISFMKFKESELDVSLFKSILDRVEFGDNKFSIDMIKYGDIFLKLLFYDNIINNKIPNDKY